MRTDSLRDEIEVQVLELSRQSFGGAALSGDSLERIDFFMGIEIVFGVEIPDEEKQKLRTIADIVDYLREKAA